MRTPRITRSIGLLALTVSTAAIGVTAAEEGMWLPDQPPVDQLREVYGFEPSPEWLERCRKSAIRVSEGGSASFVSPDGLVMTNHHVVRGLLGKLSTADNDLVKNGFIARTRTEELPLPGVELDVLWEIQDITDQVNADVTDDMSPAEANNARRKARTRIEQESEERTGLVSESVTLYKGGAYQLYRYKRFTDVRMVFAPEEAAAAFGGDVDNFEYPRFCLDVSFIRVYEDGRPYHPEQYLRWSPSGAQADEPVFVWGHPGTTRRLYTVDHLRFLRDTQYPASLASIWRAESKYAEWASRSDENDRLVSSNLTGVRNYRKFVTGVQAGLQDPAIFDRKVAAEAHLRAAVAANPEWNAKWGDAWEQIAQAQDTYTEFYERRAALRMWSDLFTHARQIVRLADESTKPNTERLREYRDTNIPSIELELYSDAPIHDDLEAMKFAEYLGSMAERLGSDDELVVALLDGKSPRVRADEIVRNTTIKTPERRRQLVEGGIDAVSSANDPLLEFMRVLDTEDRRLRTRYEDEVEGVERDAYAKIAAAQFAVLGDGLYPDATFTLRMSVGRIIGYQEPGGFVEPFTNLAGLYRRRDLRHATPPFDLPQSWLDAESTLDLSTPFNFVSTNDIIGGNSGSPVVNRDAEVVGLIFDGNIHFLIADVIYDSTMGRSVSVDSRAIIEALRKVYDADTLADELTGR